MQEAFRPRVKIPDAQVEPFIFPLGGPPEPVTVQIWPSTPWAPQREPTGKKATLGSRQSTSAEKEGTHTFRACSACDFEVPVRLSTLYFENKGTCFEDRPETCHRCGATFELPGKRREK